jgi:hypothetical protein
MTTKPRLLDLFCGAGGAARGYQLAGFHVTGIDINPQPRYAGDVFLQGDALAYVAAHGHEYDAIHASPPCQAYSAKTRDKTPHPDLVAATRAALVATGRPYVIENVPGAPLVDPITLCGSSFGLRVRRHRRFESNVLLFALPCRHAWQDADKPYLLYDHGRWFYSGVVHVFGTGGGKAAQSWPEAMGIDWMDRRELSQAIPPAYTHHLGRQLLTPKERPHVPDQPQLFDVR